MALRTAGQPERTELSYPMLKTTDRDRGGELANRLPSTSGNWSQRVITAREKWP